MKVGWLAVNAKAMNPAHQAKSPFEKKAAEALACGRESYDAVQDKTYRYAGAINLGNQCLKCHLPIFRLSAASQLDLRLRVAVRVSPVFNQYRGVTELGWGAVDTWELNRKKFAHINTSSQVFAHLPGPPWFPQCWQAVSVEFFSISSVIFLE